MSDPNQRIAGVRFRNAGKIQYFHTAGMRLEAGEYVVVETVRGPEIGKVVIAPDQVVVNELGREELKPILRLATEDDIRKLDDLRQRAHDLLPEARALAQEAGFPAHVDAADFTLDGHRLTFSFTSEERLDYRDFLRKAGDRFGAKVDMRQLGARDRAKAAGGYGVCGRELCCASWLTTFPAISIRMAKEQELPLNPQKISGLCGRLLCCLSYEEEGYKAMRQTLPKTGQRCSTPTGEGRVVAVNILRRQVTLLVDGQRVEVPDRDLGTVVRWDTSAKNAPPPPSLSRAEAIAQGLIEPTEEDLHPEAPPAEDWLAVPVGRPDGGAGRGRLPAPAPRREGAPRSPLKATGEPGQRSRPSPGQPGPPQGGREGRGEQRPPRGPRPVEGPGGEPPAARTFQRSEGGSLPPRSRDDRPHSSEAPPAAEQPGDRPRRRRGRGGRRPESPPGGD
ncbi:MAG: hypothetical protein IT304_11505 [Dehalococcoidia bacterium]|nr:hypothetical protein [Dehalococcoidia bacterium]